MFNQTRLTEAFHLFDATNSEDPNLETDTAGQPLAKEVLYAQRMSACLAPDVPRPCSWRPTASTSGAGLFRGPTSP